MSAPTIPPKHLTPSNKNGIKSPCPRISKPVFKKRSDPKPKKDLFVSPTSPRPVLSSESDSDDRTESDSDDHTPICSRCHAYTRPGRRSGPTGFLCPRCDKKLRKSELDTEREKICSDCNRIFKWPAHLCFDRIFCSRGCVEEFTTEAALRFDRTVVRFNRCLRWYRNGLTTVFQPDEAAIAEWSTDADRSVPRPAFDAEHQVVTPLELWEGRVWRCQLCNSLGKDCVCEPHPHFSPYLLVLPRDEDPPVESSVDRSCSSSETARPLSRVDRLEEGTRVSGYVDRDRDGSDLRVDHDSHLVVPRWAFRLLESIQKDRSPEPKFSPKRRPVLWQILVGQRGRHFASIDANTTWSLVRPLVFVPTEPKYEDAFVLDASQILEVRCRCLLTDEELVLPYSLCDHRVDLSLVDGDGDASNLVSEHHTNYADQLFRARISPVDLVTPNSSLRLVSRLVVNEDGPLYTLVATLRSLEYDLIKDASRACEPPVRPADFTVYLEKTVPEALGDLVNGAHEFRRLLSTPLKLREAPASSCPAAISAVESVKTPPAQTRSTKRKRNRRRKSRINIASSQ